MNVVGKKIKGLRVHDNIRQNEFAKIIDVLLSRYEFIEKKPNYDTFQKIVDFFNASID